MGGPIMTTSKNASCRYYYIVTKPYPTIRTRIFSGKLFTECSSLCTRKIVFNIKVTSETSEFFVGKWDWNAVFEHRKNDSSMIIWGNTEGNNVSNLLSNRAFIIKQRQIENFWANFEKWVLFSHSFGYRRVIMTPQIMRPTVKIGHGIVSVKTNVDLQWALRYETILPYSSG